VEHLQLRQSRMVAKELDLLEPFFDQEGEQGVDGHGRLRRWGRGYLQPKI
jgi:hypothetical protein